MSSPPKTRLTRYGGWLPSRIVYEKFVDYHVGKAVDRHQKYKARLPNIPLNVPLPPGEEAPHIPSVQAFADVINGDPVLRGLFDKIFLQVSPLNQVPDFDTLLFLLDGILVQAPSYFVATYPDGTVIGEPVGVPIYLIFDLLSNTGAAYDLFRLGGFNTAIRDLLNSWGAYLANPNPPAPLPPSNSTLNTSELGWFSTDALRKLETYLGDLTFEQTYICPTPDADNRGFESWDAFFTRKLQPGVRPVQDPDNPYLIHSACESTVYRFSENVKLHDQFWLKAQPYSLYDMLDGDNGLGYAEQFVGGTVYQAFLSPLDYHRWHSPVKGTILDAYVVAGTYYAVLPDDGAGPNDPDLKEGDPHGAIIRSQAWLNVAATRALIFIQADDPVGLVAFIGVGMVEVSTCDISVKKGDQVNIGDELGMFHFGGSSHTLIFRPGIKIVLEDGVEVDQHVWVNSLLASVEVPPNA
ncbi:phosphatidylserine decarboxylase [Phlebopus sp. FC_14]|nr:phosphatidylserine decarboxylase [Phlebopus sp. FC_14]